MIFHSFKMCFFYLAIIFYIFCINRGLDFFFSHTSFFLCFKKKKNFLSVTCSCLCLACFSCSFLPNVALEVCRCYATATHIGHHVIHCFLIFSFFFFLCVPWLTMWLCRPIHSDSDITVRAACKPSLICGLHFCRKWDFVFDWVKGVVWEYVWVNVCKL